MRWCHINDKIWCVIDNNYDNNNDNDDDSVNNAIYNLHVI